jgi:hypothetical protein
MRELPILFSAPLVRAILADTKSVTRRPVKPGVMDVPVDPGAMASTREEYARDMLSRCPFGVPGDRLWCRETFAPFGCRTHNGDLPYETASELHCTCRSGAWYRADVLPGDDDSTTRWTPSIHMPRWASRILLEVTNVRVERLQDITEDDAKAEGVTPTNGHPVRGSVFGCGPTCREGFAQTWIDIYGPESWAANGFVWRVAFKRIEVR